MRSVQDIFVPLALGTINAIPLEKFFDLAGLSDFVHDLPHVAWLIEEDLTPPSERTPKPDGHGEQVENFFCLALRLPGVGAFVFQFPTSKINFSFPIPKNHPHLAPP